MSVEEEFDYQAYTREHPPDPSKIHRGPQARKLRLKRKMEELARHTENQETPSEQERNNTVENPGIED